MKKEVGEVLKKPDELYDAQIIQQGLLPKRRHFSRLFEDWFALYLPQNIISGDFYWVGERNELQYLAVGDCTGHGVSAALLSVLAINLFEYAVMNKGLKKTNKILQEVDKKFIESFKNYGQDNFDNPWIDLSIVCIDKKEKKIHFSSANRKVLHINTKKEINIYKINHYPIGGWQIENRRKFESKSISYEAGDTLYLGSDGFQDQIGGSKNKKYKSGQLHNFIADNSHLPFNIQKQKLVSEFAGWKKDNLQVDDVCIVGIRLY